MGYNGYLSCMSVCGRETENIQHQTSKAPCLRHYWMLGVQCWMLDVSEVHGQGAGLCRLGGGHTSWLRLGRGGRHGASRAVERDFTPGPWTAMQVDAGQNGHHFDEHLIAQEFDSDDADT